MITQQNLKNGDEAIILLGGLCDEIGGSYYLKQIHDLKTSDAPKPDLEAEKRSNSLILSLISNRQVIAAHDISEGGLLVALAEMLFAQEQTFGAKLEVEWETEHNRIDAQLFGESQGRVILAVYPDLANSVLKSAQAVNVPAICLGLATNERRLIIRSPSSNDEIEWDTCDLRQVWECAISNAMSEI